MGGYAGRVFRGDEWLCVSEGLAFPRKAIGSIVGSIGVLRLDRSCCEDGTCGKFFGGDFFGDLFG